MNNTLKDKLWKILYGYHDAGFADDDKVRGFDAVIEQLLSLIDEEKTEAYKKGFIDCQVMAKSGKYPELSVSQEK